MSKLHSALYSSLLLLGVSIDAFAGQGMYVNFINLQKNQDITSRIYNTSCVDFTNDPIPMNNRTYIEATNSGWSCIPAKSSKFDIDFNQNGQLVASYHVVLSTHGSEITPTLTPSANDNIAVASDFFPHDSSHNYDTQDRWDVYFSAPVSHWMGDLSNNENFANTSLKNIVLPGMHDSGTFGINDSSAGSPDTDGFLAELIRLNLAKGIIAGWSRAQHANFTEQLNAGIRYFDIRLCNKNGAAYICHGLYGDSFTSFLQQLQSFLAQPENQHEIIVVDINHLYQFNPQLHQAVIADLQDKLNLKLALTNQFSPSSKLSDFWNNGKQVIVLYSDEDTVKQFPNVLWSQSAISSPWPNTTDAGTLLGKMQENLQDRQQNQFFVLQSQLTPDTNSIVSGLLDITKVYPRSLQDLTGTYQDSVYKWLDDHAADVKARGNIIIVDWTNGLWLTNYAIQHNATS